MKRSLILAAVLAAASGAGLAQTASYGGALAAKPYGLIDVTVRYTTNESADGRTRTALGDGAVTGSRLGIRGIGDLGGGLKAVYVLEAGFSPDTGTLQQDGRLFGREAYVGLSGRQGTLAIGRMYTGTYDLLSSFDAFGLANNDILAPQKQQYTGLRYDNMVKYVGRFGALELAADLSAARSGLEPPGPFNQTGGYDYSAAYSVDGWRIGASYGGQHGVASYFGGAVPMQTQKTWAVGASYQFPFVKVFANYINATLETSDIRNDAYQFSFTWQVLRNAQVLGTWTRDQMKTGGVDGTRDDMGLMFDYYLSVHTNVYIEGDYNRLRDTWMAVGSAASYANYDPTNGPFYAGYPTRSQLMVGMRHRF